MTDEYPKFGKIPRLHKPIVITEKIDGTNGLISVRVDHGSTILPGETRVFVNDGETSQAFIIGAGSRNRWLTPGADNYGFARWVAENATELATLGVGYHYGEWFGQGIQRGYGMCHREFALFNVAKWYDPAYNDEADVITDFPNANPCPDCCTVVPVLTIRDASEINKAVEASVTILRQHGSIIAPFDNPEGVIVYHLAAGQYFKVLLDNDDVPKSLVGSTV